MSDGQALFAVLVLLYLSDCWIWVAAHATAFRAPWCGRCRTLRAGARFGNARGTPVLLNPFPPFGAVFLGQFPPVAISPRGFTRAAAEGVEGGQRAVDFKVAEVDSREEWLTVNGERFVRVGRASEASRWAGLIRKVGAAPGPASACEDLIRRFLEEGFQRDTAVERLKEVESLAGKLRWRAVVFWGFLYCATPVLAVTVGLNRVLLPSAALMLLSAILISRSFTKAHRQLHPNRRSERIAEVLKMVLCPPVAIRSTDLLTAHSMEGFNPILLGSLLLRADEKHAFLCDRLCQLRYPLRRPVDDPVSAEIIAFFGRLELEIAIQRLKAWGEPAAEEWNEPPRRDGVSRSYCPRCRSQLNSGAGECPDCPGVGLVSFPEEAAAAR